MNDLDVLNRVTEMCEESCSPDQMTAWEPLRDYLLETRKSLHGVRPTQRAADGEPERPIRHVGPLDVPRR